MTATHNGPTRVAHLDEHRLLGSLRTGDLAGAEELVHRVVGDAWLLALVVQQRAELATDLATRALVRTLADALDGRLAGGVAFRAAALRTVRDQSLVRRISVSDGGDLAGDDALSCFGQLAEPSRSALLLADIVLLPDDQLGHPLALPNEEARALADRAGAALRQRLAHRLGGRLTSDECRAALERAAAREADDEAGEADTHLHTCARCRQQHDHLVGAADRVREALPTPPAHLDAQVLEAWAGLLSARKATADGYPVTSNTLLGRVAAAGPAARRTVAAAAAAVLVAGLVAVGAGSGPRPAQPTGTAVAAAPTTALTEPSPSASPASTTSAPTTTTPGATAAVAPDAALTAQLLQTLTTAVTTASIPPAAGGGGTGSGAAGNSVQPTNVGSPTPANPATPSAPSTTVAPAPTTTQAPAPTTTAPAPTTTTNPLQPVVDLVNKVLHP